MSPDEILLAVPTRGSVGWATATRLEAIRDEHPGLPPILYQPGNLSVALVRNAIVNHFLAGEWSVLAMVDDDVVPPLTFLNNTVQHLGDGYGLVCVPHPMPVPPDMSRMALGLFMRNDNGSHRFVNELEVGLGECDAVATGAVVVSREALEALGPLPFRIEHDPDAMVTSDDFAFCADLRAAGFKVGYWFDGWFSDHRTEATLAPLMQRSLRTVAAS